MALKDDVKVHLRLVSTSTDTEVDDLIASAKKDLEISGVDAMSIDDTDPLIKRAIVLYCKANYGYNNVESDRFRASYDLLKSHLSMSGDYAVE